MSDSTSSPNGAPPPKQSTPQDGLLKIGDFARLAGTNLRTLRYYEELGLMKAAARSKGGFRYYRATDKNRLHLIRDLQELGLALDAIRDLLDTRSAGADREAFFAKVRAALLEQDRLLSERVAQLQEQRQRIHEALGQVSACEGCAHMPGPDNNHCEPCTLTGKPLPENVSALY